MSAFKLFLVILAAGVVLWVIIDTIQQDRRIDREIRETRHLIDDYKREIR